MPDDYYVLQRSGEEIDALLGIAGAGAVRYDAAQTLTDAQKEQARNNISAMQGIESTDHPGCNYVLNGSTVEWINPPMKLGVEYRTTERFLGKPVYVKAINFGAVAKGLNQVSFMPSGAISIRCYALLTSGSVTIPWIGTPGTDQSFCSINGANARIYSTSAFPDGAVAFVGYYYKPNE